MVGIGRGVDVETRCRDARSEARVVSRDRIVKAEVEGLGGVHRDGVQTESHRVGALGVAAAGQGGAVHGRGEIVQGLRPSGRRADRADDDLDVSGVARIVIAALDADRRAGARCR